MAHPVVQPTPDATGRIGGAATRGAILEATLRRLVADRVRRHRDNLWTRGGELIRLRYDDVSLRTARR
jgi:hypothetical protein